MDESLRRSLILFDKRGIRVYNKKVFKIISMSSHVCGSLLFDGLLDMWVFCFSGYKIIFLEVPNE